MELNERSTLIPTEKIIPKPINVGYNAKHLKKSLGCFDIFVYVVSTIIGAGIYVSPGLVAKYTNNMGTSLIIWTISGIVCLFGALCFCELAVALRKTGNRYIFIKETYGDLAGFCIIWAQILIISPTGIAVISVTISEHAVGIFSNVSRIEDQWLVRILAASCCVLSGFINCINTSFSAKVQTVFGAVQIVGMALFICIGIWKVSTGETHTYQAMFSSTGNKTVEFSNISLAFMSALWSYDGWGGTVSLNEELQDMNRNLRLGIITGMPFVIMVFLLFNLALMSVLTHAEMGRSITVATSFIEKSIGSRYAVMVPIIVALSCFGSLNSTIMSGSRSLLSAGREGHFPWPFSFIHKERCTPVPALLLLMSLSILWILTLGSQLINLLTYFSLGIWLAYGAALCGVIVLRIRRPDLARPYKVWLMYPIFTTIVSGYIIMVPFFKRPIHCVICICIHLSAVPVYYIKANYTPEAVKMCGDKFSSWALYRLPLVECVFEMNTSETQILSKDSEL